LERKHPDWHWPQAISDERNNSRFRLVIGSSDLFVAWQSQWFHTLIVHGFYDFDNVFYASGFYGRAVTNFSRGLHRSQDRLSSASRWGTVLMVVSVLGMTMAREFGEI
jgi:hypothetical protein